MTHWSNEKVRDSVGRIIYAKLETPNRQIVSEQSGPTLGFTTNSGTFKKTGERIAYSPDPALLLHDDEEEV